jgi:glutamate-1-semialdehyde aminotransferase
MAAKGDHMRSSFNEFAQQKGLPAIMTGAASLSQVHLREPPVSNPRDMLDQDHKTLHDFHLYLRYNGIFTPRIHWAVLSVAHSDEDLEWAIRAHKVSLEASIKAQAARS